MQQKSTIAELTLSPQKKHSDPFPLAKTGFNETVY